MRMIRSLVKIVSPWYLFLPLLHLSSCGNMAHKKGRLLHFANNSGAQKLILAALKWQNILIKVTYKLWVFRKYLQHTIKARQIIVYSAFSRPYLDIKCSFK